MSRDIISEASMFCFFIFLIFFWMKLPMSLKCSNLKCNKDLKTARDNQLLIVKALVLRIRLCKRHRELPYGEGGILILQGASRSYGEDESDLNYWNRCMPLSAISEGSSRFCETATWFLCFLGDQIYPNKTCLGFIIC